MEFNLTKKTVSLMYYDLSREVYSNFDLDHKQPEFWFRNMDVMGSAIAETNFWELRFGKPWEPLEIVFNLDYLPFMWEDEVRDVLLHELAHSILHFDAGHTLMWKKTAQEIGSSGAEIMTIREFDALSNWSVANGGKRLTPFDTVPTLGYL